MQIVHGESDLISTHTLRGERDKLKDLTVSTVGISTHTLRGERDVLSISSYYPFLYFNSHAPWGA